MRLYSFPLETPSNKLYADVSNNYYYMDGKLQSHLKWPNYRSMQSMFGASERIVFCNIFGDSSVPI